MEIEELDLAAGFGSAIASALFAVAFAGEGRFHPLLLAWFEIERMTLGVLDDVLLQDFPLETAESALQGFTV